MFARRTLPFIVWNNIYRTQSLREHLVRWDENLLSLQDSDFNLSTLLAGMKYTYASGVRPDYGYRLSALDTSRNAITNRMFVDAKYRVSHLYLVDKFYRSLHSVYGSSYDRSLFIGILVFHKRITSQNLDTSFARELAGVVGKYDKFHAWIYMCIVRTTCFLQRVMPYKWARNIPLLCHLLGSLRADRRKQHLIAGLVIEP